MMQRYNLESIRKLLTEGFTDRELRDFCFYNPDFRPVYEQLTQSTGKAQIVNEILEYTDRKLKFEIVLDWARKNNPTKYEQHQPYYSAITIAPTSNSSGRGGKSRKETAKSVGSSGNRGRGGKSRKKISKPVGSDEAPVDFVIVTALEEERDAVLRKLPGWEKLPPSEDKVQIYYAADLPVTLSNGMKGTYRVIVMPLLGMGRVKATAATAEAIQRWSPRYVLLVGIAGGIAAKGVSLGDILISDQIVGYELQKLTSPAGRPEIRWEVHHADPRLVGAARNFSHEDWQKLITTTRPPGGAPQRHVGPIASGDKVIAVEEALRQYREGWPALIGVEMEADGVATASFQAAQAPGFFMVRSVSDLADEDKNARRVGRWRPYACEAAASYAIALLQSGPVPLLNIITQPEPEGGDRVPVVASVTAMQPALDLAIEVPGGAMRPDSPFYIERNADNNCWNYIAGAHPVTLFVQAPRQMGKSSLMHRMIDQAARELHKRSAFIDFQEVDRKYFANNAEEKFLKEFCGMVSRALGIDEAIDQYWRKPGANIFKCGLYMSDHVIPRVGQPFILAIDEVNRLLNSRFRDDFFGMLRVWHNKRAIDEQFKKMSLFLSSSAEASLLIDNEEQSPFNVATYISLPEFTQGEVEELNRRYHSPLNQSQVNELMALVEGHPFLTNLALYQLTVGQTSVNTFFTEAVEETGPFGKHLHDQLLYISDRPELKQAMIEIWCKHTYEENKIFHRLKQAGLIKRIGKQVAPRNNLYERYFARYLNL